MEMEQSTPDQGAKKVWSLLRALLFVLRKGLWKAKFILDLRALLKQGKLAGEAICSLMLHHYSAVSCRSDDAHLSFVSPRDYEFSCSSSPADYSYFHSGRNKHGRRFGDSRLRRSSRLPKPHAATLTAACRILETLNRETAAAMAAEASPLVALPGFGKSPVVRQLRITDSPFPLKDDGDSHQVDVAAEEFIKNFYKDLRLQKITMAALDSPYHYDAWR